MKIVSKINIKYVNISFNIPILFNRLDKKIQVELRFVAKKKKKGIDKHWFMKGR